VARIARGLQHLGTREESYKLQGIGNRVLLTASIAAKLSLREKLRKEDKLGPSEGLTNNEKSKELACNQPRSADGPDSVGSMAEGPVPGAELPSAHSFARS
jgi:hypothetical protein